MSKFFKRSRFRLSLLTFILVVSLLGTTIGVWTSMIRPIQKQWQAAETILEIGGSVETSPSPVPLWIKSVLPIGQRDNIVAVNFNRHQATDSAIEALQRLPHLKRLYLERANVQPAHIPTIGKLPNVERLAIWGNYSLRETDIEKLAEMKSLELVDFHANDGYTIDPGPTLNWKVLLPFAARQDVRVKHDCFRGSYRLKSQEVMPFFELKKQNQITDFKKPDYWPANVSIDQAQPKDVLDVLRVLPDCHWANFSFRSPEMLKETIAEILAANPAQQTSLRFYMKDASGIALKSLLNSLASDLAGNVLELEICDYLVDTFEVKIVLADSGKAKRISLFLVWTEEKFPFDQLLDCLWASNLYGARSLRLKSQTDSRKDMLRKRLTKTKIKTVFPQLKNVAIANKDFPLRQ